MALTEAGGSSLGLDDILLSTANGEGASRVGIEDAAGNFTGTTVEAALAELISSHFLSTVVDKATNFTVALGDKNTFFDVTGTSLVSLLAEATAGEGFALVVNNAGVGVVTVEDDAAVALFTLAAGEWVILVCDGATWKGIQYTAPVGASDISNLVAKPIDRLLQYYGDGSDGVFSSVGASTLSNLLYNHTTFALNSGHTITIDTPVCIIRATTSIVIDGDTNATGDLIAVGAGANMGKLAGSPGSSGGGGGGGGASLDGSSDIAFPGKPGEDGDSSNFVQGGAGGAQGASLVSPNGSNGTAGAAPLTTQKALIASLFSTLLSGGGRKGGDGGEGGFDLVNIVGSRIPAGAVGIGGLGGALIVLIAPSITIAAASTTNLTGQAGTNATAPAAGGSNSGGGGGGGGGSLIKVSPSITDAGTTITTGGAGGSGTASGFGGTGGDGAAGGAGYTYEIDPTA